jgi:uncharacterized protein
MLDLTTPLNDADFDRLDRLLQRANPDGAMNVSEMDGFFCASVCGPGQKSLTSYFDYVLGSDLDDSRAFRSVLGEAEQIATLLTRHWNTIAATLMAGKPHIPIFDLDADGQPVGYDWADGFAEGMNLEKSKWNRLIRDKRSAFLVAPIMFILADADPDLAPELALDEVSAEKRLEIMAGVVHCLGHLFQHFHGSTKTGSGKMP